MARKSQVELAIDRLKAAQESLQLRYEAECFALNHAIEALKEPGVRRKPKPKVAALSDRTQAAG